MSNAIYDMGKWRHGFIKGLIFISDLIRNYTKYNRDENKNLKIKKMTTKDILTVIDYVILNNDICNSILDGHDINFSYDTERKQIKKWSVKNNDD